MCKDRIEAAALSVDGVKTAHWDAESQVIHIDHNKEVLVDLIHNSIAASGHDTKLKKAPDDVYNALPACCLYDRLNKKKVICFPFLIISN